MKFLLIAILFAGSAAAIPGQAPTAARNPLARRYVAGEKLLYRMQGVNDQWQYQLQAEGVVKRDAGGSYFEEYVWTNMLSGGQAVALSPTTVEFRQKLSLDQSRNPALPDLSKVDTKLIGPITDMLTFYSDLWLAVKAGQLVKEGDHFYFKKGSANSWADGTYITSGEDDIDFDMSLKSIDPAAKTAVVVVRHVVPEKPQVKFPAAWMEKPVADTPNNWEQVMRGQDGKFVASVGQETFDVEMKISLDDGKILSGSLDNSVTTMERSCTDKELTSCTAASPHRTHRKIEIQLVR